MSQLAVKIETKQFVITSELTPPKGTDLSGIEAKAALLSPHVDAFNVTDSHSSKMSMSPVAAARFLLERDVEPILQMTTRDRNRIALQSDLLGAWSLGIENVVMMGGDPPHLGDHPEAKPVFDVYADELIRAATCLNGGTDMMGNALQGSTGFNIGAVVNPGADNLDEELERLDAKVRAGAGFFQTQAIYDADLFAQFMERISHLDIAILAGVLPIKSAAMANHMNAKIPGIDIPEVLVRRIDEATDPVAESIEIAAAIIRDISPLCQGIHIMALGWEDQVPAILERAG